MLFERMTPDQEWAAGLVARLPTEWAGEMLDVWGRKHLDDRTGANLAHMALAKELAVIRIALDANDSEICRAAKELADKCMEVEKLYPMRVQRDFWERRMARGAMERICVAQGVEPPDVDTDEGAVARMKDDLWWRRRIRRLHGKAVEHAAIKLGRVCKGREIYCSNRSVESRAQQIERNTLILESTLATNELGQEFSLAELAAKGPSNKEIRRAELMTRIAGFEQIADKIGHRACMITITCPSRMHKMRTRGKTKSIVVENRKYDGTSPTEASQHLGRVWARIRSNLDRRGVKLYGFRIAEPNHDGTPHWHILCFFPPEISEGRQLFPRLAAIFRRYALGRGEVKEPDHSEGTFTRTPYRFKYHAVEAAKALAEQKRHLWAVAERKRQNSERGAKAHRVKCELIDKEKGTAAGYVAKYIAKNIDGYMVEKDLFGNDMITVTRRVEAWASKWNIRQFQQIGGAPVGPWRELRRVESIPEGAPQEMTDAWHAVNKMQVLEGRAVASVSWAKYTNAQGGVFCGRKYRIRVAMRPRPGELNRYGEPACPVAMGVECNKRELYKPAHMAHMPWGFAERNVLWIAESNRHTWTITRQGSGAGVKGARIEAGAKRTPWTRVNNCTHGAETVIQEGAGGQLLRVQHAENRNHASPGAGQTGRPDRKHAEQPAPDRPGRAPGGHRNGAVRGLRAESAADCWPFGGD